MPMPWIVRFTGGSLKRSAMTILLILSLLKSAIPWACCWLRKGRDELAALLGVATRVGVNNPRAHGWSISIILSLFISFTDYFFHLASREYILMLVGSLFTSFLLDCLIYENISQNKDEKLAERIRITIRRLKVLVPVVTQLVSYLLGRPMPIVDGFVSMLKTAWTEYGPVAREFFKKLLEVFLSDTPNSA